MKSFSFSSLDSFLGQVTNCPTCVGTGGNAAQDCENMIVMRDCKEKEVCAIGSGNNYIWRGCISRSRFDGMQPKCQKIKGNCVMAMCDTANCRPELPTRK